jgi:hypothetical protein
VFLSIATGRIGEASAVARRVALGAVAAWLALGTPAAAQPVVVTCERLEAEQASELKARMRLALRSAPRGARPLSIRVECDGDSGPARLIWEGAFREPLRIDEGEGLIEGALLALEQRLAEPPTSRPERAPPGPPEKPEPPARAGGIGAGIRFEPIRGPVYYGPRIDFGIPVGPVALIGLASIRTAPKDTVLVGGELGLGLGAPYFADWNLGLAATMGLEALSAISASGGPESSRWDSAAVVSLGPRAAWTLDRTTFWAGIDWRPRLSTVSIDSPRVELGNSSVGISLGLVFGLDLADPRRR